MRINAIVRGRTILLLSSVLAAGPVLSISAAADPTTDDVSALGAGMNCDAPLLVDGVAVRNPFHPNVDTNAPGFAEAFAQYQAALTEHALPRQTADTPLPPRNPYHPNADVTSAAYRAAEAEYRAELADYEAQHASQTPPLPPNPYHPNVDVTSAEFQRAFAAYIAAVSAPAQGSDLPPNPYHPNADVNALDFQAAMLVYSELQRRTESASASSPPSCDGNHAAQ